MQFFFAIYLGIAQNQKLPRYIRFNASQAVVLDILLILPDVVNSLFTVRDIDSYREHLTRCRSN